MSKNSIIAFDQVNNPDWPGETQTLLSSLNLNNYDLKLSLLNLIYLI